MITKIKIKIKHNKKKQLCFEKEVTKKRTKRGMSNASDTQRYVPKTPNAGADDDDEPSVSISKSKSKSTIQSLKDKVLMSPLGFMSPKSPGATSPSWQTDEPHINFAEKQEIVMDQFETFKEKMSREVWCFSFFL